MTGAPMRGLLLILKTKKGADAMPAPLIRLICNDLLCLNELAIGRFPRSILRLCLDAVFSGPLAS